MPLGIGTKTLAVLLAIGAALAFSRKVFGESILGGLGQEIGQFGAGVSGTIGGLGTAFGQFGQGIQTGISALLSPQITPSLVPTIGFRLILPWDIGQQNESLASNSAINAVSSNLATARTPVTAAERRML